MLNENINWSEIRKVLPVELSYWQGKMFIKDFEEHRDAVSNGYEWDFTL